MKIPKELLDYIVDVSEKIHHGTITIDINADRPGRFDVITQTRERFVKDPEKNRLHSA